MGAREGVVLDSVARVDSVAVPPAEGDDDHSTTFVIPLEGESENASAGTEYGMSEGPWVKVGKNDWV